MPTFQAWLWRSYAERHRYLGEPELDVARAVKGLFTAFTAGGHFLRDILTGRGHLADPKFVVLSVGGVVVLIATLVCLAGSLLKPRALVFGLVWLLPFHTLLNWWFVPTVEKYHAGALPGFVLIVTAGLVALTSRMAERSRAVACAGFIGLCAAVNLFGVVLPLRAWGRETVLAEQKIRALNEEHHGRVVFVACDQIRSVAHAGVQFLRLRTSWKNDEAQDRQTALEWTQARFSEGDEPYLIGRYCHPDDWNIAWSKTPFDLFFLDQYFRRVPTAITGVPIDQIVATDPYTWITGDVYRLERLGGRP
jgi:hypothetical protein